MVKVGVDFDWQVVRVSLLNHRAGDLIGEAGWSRCAGRSHLDHIDTAEREFSDGCNRTAFPLTTWPMTAALPRPPGAQSIGPATTGRTPKMRPFSYAVRSSMEWSFGAPRSRTVVITYARARVRLRVPTAVAITAVRRGRLPVAS